MHPFLDIPVTTRSRPNQNVREALDNSGTHARDECVHLVTSLTIVVCTLHSRGLIRVSGVSPFRVLLVHLFNFLCHIRKI